MIKRCQNNIVSNKHIITYVYASLILEFAVRVDENIFS